MHRIQAILLCGVTCVLLAGQVGAESDAKPKLAEVLAKAAAAYEAIPKQDVTEKQAIEAGRGFVSLLQSVADRFESTATGREPGTAHWKAHVLNKDGKGIDCVRFRTPKGEPCDMGWGFISQVNAIEAWYIIPAKGEAGPGFKNFFDLTRDAAGPNVFVQYLAADALKPDTEYLLWFKLHGPDPLETSLAINLLPKGTIKDEADDLIKVIALEDGLREYQARRDKHSGK